MKKYTVLFTLLLTVLMATPVLSQETYTWVGASGSSWATSTNWNPTRTILEDNDILQFNSGLTLTITSVPDQRVGRVNVSNNTNITLSSLASVSLEVEGITGVDIVIEDGSALTLGGSYDLQLKLYTSGTTADISGTLTVNEYGEYDSDDSGVLTTVSGTGTIINYGAVEGDTSTMTFASGSTYNHAQNGGTVPDATWNANSTCEITRVTTSRPSGYKQSFGHFTWNCPNQTMTGSSLGTDFASSTYPIQGNFTMQNTGTGKCYFTSTVQDNYINGNFVMNGGTLEITNGYDRAVYVGGNFSMTGGTLVLSEDSVIGTLNIPGDFSHTYGTITETDSGSGAFVFSKSGTQTYTSGGTISNTINFTVNSGSTLQMASNSTIVSGGGTFTLSSGGTLGITSTAGITSSGATGNVQVSSTRTYSTGANYTYNGTAAQNTGSGLPATVNNLTISNTADAVTLGGAGTNNSVAVGGMLQIDSGATLTPPATAVVSGAGTLIGSGTVQVTRTAAIADFSSQYSIANKTLTNLTVEYAGSGVAQTGSALTYGNLKINNSSGVSLAGTATVNGMLTLTSGNVTTDSNTLAIGSSGSVSRTSGHIIGNLQKNVATGENVARTFEIGDASNYTPIDITFVNVSNAGDVIAKTTAGDHADIGNSGLNFSKSVNRKWTLTNSDMVYDTYNATFTFVTGDVDDGASTRNFLVRRNDGTWHATTTGVRTETTTQAIGISAMSDFAIGESAATTQKTLSEAVTVGWVEGTAYIYDGTEFQIYQYDTTTDIPAWEGFFIAVKQDVNLLIPANTSPPPVTSPMTKTLTSDTWYLISSPLASSIGGNAKSNLSTGGLLPDDNNFADVDNWRIYKRQYMDGEYYNGNSEDFLPGRGFFIKHKYGVNKDISVTGFGASGNSGYYEMKLPITNITPSTKTFHQVGNPYWYSIKWSDCKFSQSMDEINPLGKIASSLPPDKTETWHVRLELVSNDGKAYDTYNRAGVILTEGGNPNFFTASELTPPEPYVSLALKDPSNPEREALAYDYRNPGQGVYTWSVNLGTSYERIDAALSMKEFFNVPEWMDFRLTDPKTGESYAVTGDKTIPVSLTKDTVKTFILTASKELPTVVDAETPKAFGITGIHPNPFNPSTTINFNLAVSGTAKVSIFNLNGQLVEWLVNGQMKAGSHNVVWNASRYASGVYIVVAESNGLKQSRKITLMK